MRRAITVGVEYQSTVVRVCRNRPPLPRTFYRRVLKSKKSEKFMNKGFVFKLNSMNSYELCKIGLTYLYGKRKVNDVGVSTLPIDF